MSTGNDDMNARLRRRPDSPAQARLRARLAGPSDLDPEEILDQVAADDDPEAVRRLDPATRQRLSRHLVDGQAIEREVARRRKQRQEEDRLAASVRGDVI